jgi:hypothetical protein
MAVTAACGLPQPVSQRTLRLQHPAMPVRRRSRIRIAESKVLRIPGDSDNFEFVVLFGGKAKAFPERICVPKILPRYCFADDRNRRATPIISRVELPSQH